MSCTRTAAAESGSPIASCTASAWPASVPYSGLFFSDAVVAIGTDLELRPKAKYQFRLSAIGEFVIQFFAPLRR